MLTLRFALILVTSAAILAAQSSLTVTASRQVYSSPSSNQLSIAMTVTSPLTAGLDDVISALPGLGLNSANLRSVSGTSATPGSTATIARLQWSFAVQVELAKAPDFISTLTSLQQTFSKANNGWGLTFSAANATSSVPECPAADLLSDAQSRAKDVASASGFTVGKILALSNAVLPAGGSQSAISRVSASFSAIEFIQSSAVCTVAVKFELLQ